jgi:hypothetical protein
MCVSVKTLEPRTVEVRQGAYGRNSGHESRVEWLQCRVLEIEGSQCCPKAARRYLVTRTSEVRIKDHINLPRYLLLLSLVYIGVDKA